jgi:LmbE family N-acetylglucosaminyl deacetylase
LRGELAKLKGDYEHHKQKDFVMLVHRVEALEKALRQLQVEVSNIHVPAPSRPQPTHPHPTEHFDNSALDKLAGRVMQLEG